MATKINFEKMKLDKNTKTTLIHTNDFHFLLKKRGVSSIIALQKKKVERAAKNQEGNLPTFPP